MANLHYMRKPNRRKYEGHGTIYKLKDVILCHGIHNIPYEEKKLFFEA